MSDHGVIEVEHRVSAATDIVFSYFVDPDKYRLWQGVDAELDPRPGGRYKVRYHTAGGVRGEFVNVEPHRRIVFTWGWEGDADMPAVLRQIEPGISTVEVTLTPDGEGTIVRVRHSGLPTEDGRRLHADAWPSYLARLAAVVAGEEPGPDIGAVGMEAAVTRARQPRSP